MFRYDFLKHPTYIFFLLFPLYCPPSLTEVSISSFELKLTWEPPPPGAALIVSEGAMQAAKQER